MITYQLTFSTKLLTSSTMTVLSTLLHATSYQSPFLRTLIPSIGLAYGIQGLVAIPSILAQSETYYDLSGSLTYLSCTALSLYLPTIRARNAAALAGTVKPAWPSLIGALMGKPGSGLNWRQVVLSAAVSVWATRCKLQTPSTAQLLLSFTVIMSNAVSVMIMQAHPNDATLSL